MSFDTVLSLLFLLVFIVLPVLSRILRRRAGTPRAGSESAERTTPGRPPSADVGGEVPPWLAEAQRRVREAREAERGGARGPAEPAAPTGADSGAAPETRGGVGAPARPAETGDRPLVPQDVGHAMVPPAERGLVRQDAGHPMAPPAERGLVRQDAGHPMAPPPERGLVPGDPFEVPTAPRARPLVPEDPFAKGLARRVGASEEGAAARAAGEARAPRQGATAPGEIEYVVIEAVARRRRARHRTRMRRHAPHGRARLEVVDLLRFEREAVVSGLIWHEILDEPAWKRRRRRASSRPRSR